jgi:hypothetical protein
VLMGIASLHPSYDRAAERLPEVTFSSSAGG